MKYRKLCKFLDGVNDPNKEFDSVYDSGGTASVWPSPTGDFGNAVRFGSPSDNSDYQLLNTDPIPQIDSGDFLCHSQWYRAPNHGYNTNILVHPIVTGYGNSMGLWIWDISTGNSPGDHRFQVISDWTEYTPVENNIDFNLDTNWHFVETEVKYHASEGHGKLWIDGVLIGTLANIAFNMTKVTACTSIVIGVGGSSSAFGTCSDHAELYTTLGDQRRPYDCHTNRRVPSRHSAGGRIMCPRRTVSI